MLVKKKVRILKELKCPECASYNTKKIPYKAAIDAEEAPG